MRNDNHLGVDFEVWNDQQAWFWYAVHPDHTAGTIGAAASEAEAICEARWSIEELAARPRAGAEPAPRPTVGRAGAPDPMRESTSNQIALEAWNELLANLNRYLIRARRRMA